MLHDIKNFYQTIPFATRMLELGENTRVVHELLGHKNITQILNAYTHVLEEMKKVEAAK